MDTRKFTKEEKEEIYAMINEIIFYGRAIVAAVGHDIKLVPEDRDAARRKNK